MLTVHAPWSRIEPLDKKAHTANRSLKITGKDLAAGFMAFGLLTCGDVSLEVETDDSTLVGEHDSEEDQRVLLRLGVSAHKDPQRTYRSSQPLVDYLNAHTPYRVEFRIGRSSESNELAPTAQDLVTFIEERLVEIAPLGVLSYCLADDRFGALALVRHRNRDGEALDRSVFLVPAASDMRALSDLSGRSLALGPSHSTLGHLVPRYELALASVEPGTVENLESESAIVEAIKSGAFDAGVAPEYLIDETALEGLRALHVSSPIASRPMVVRRDLPEPVRASLLEALLSFRGEASGVTGSASEFSHGFVQGAPTDYDVVCKMLDTIEASCSQGCHEAGD